MPNERQLEDHISLGLEKKKSYSGYLGLDRLLTAQNPPGQHHDEMLFIIQHQVSELWMKLIIHELSAAMTHLAQDTIDPCLKILARVKHIQRQLFEQWAVLETLTPTEYSQFRSTLGSASGFQSLQYRMIEFMLGNKHAGMLKVFSKDSDARRQLQEVLEAPSLYDHFLRYLGRQGHHVPERILNRDCSQAHQFEESLIPVFKAIYTDPHGDWAAYHMCEQLVDVEESFQLWRFRHMKTVERIIGFKPGTGGSSGVGFLKKALELTFFPELLAVRTEL